jgi:hypothetical protein
VYGVSNWPDEAVGNQRSEQRDEPAVAVEVEFEPFVAWSPAELLKSPGEEERAAMKWSCQKALHPLRRRSSSAPAPVLLRRRFS